MKKSRIISLFFILILSFSLIACGKKEEVSSETSYVVAMITDSGDITDNSFNQMTYTACQEFCTENNIKFQYYKPAKNSTPARQASIIQAIDEGSNIIVMPGYSFAEPVSIVAPNYPAVKFITLDVTKGDYLEAILGEEYDYNPDNWEISDYVDLSNVYTTNYRNEISGYMAGYAAVKLGYEKLGFMGGIAVPSVVSYGAGYAAGANDAAKELNKRVSLSFGYAGIFADNTQTTIDKSAELFANGTEIVFSCGGALYNDVACEAEKTGGKIIGVDVDQSELIDKDYGSGITVTSAMKRLDVTVKKNLTDIIINDNWNNYAGKIDTLGLISKDEPENNYCQLAMTTRFDKGFTYNDYVDLVGKLYNNEINVPNDENSIYELENVDLDYFGLLIN